MRARIKQIIEVVYFSIQCIHYLTNPYIKCNQSFMENEKCQMII